MGINSLSKNPIEYVYNSFLLKKEDENREKYEKHKGWLSASSAGSCFRKQYFNINGYDGIEKDAKSMRLLRLGTIVHEDIANAIETYQEWFESQGLKVFVEHRIELDSLNVVGHLDIGIYDEENNTLKVTDIKTAHSFKWKMLFGRNPEKNPSINYNLQVATYGAGLAGELGVDLDDVELSLTWYKKDDSQLRTQKISNEWFEHALQYWDDLNYELEDGKEPIVGDYNSPVYDWECKYCQYKGLHCEGI